MHAYYMEPLGVANSQMGPVFTCVLAAAASHQPVAPQAQPLTLINTLASSQNQLQLYDNANKSPRNILPVSYGPPNPVYGGMEAVWHCEFQRLFSRYYISHSHVWFLSPNGPPTSQSSSSSSSSWLSTATTTLQSQIHQPPPYDHTAASTGIIPLSNINFMSPSLVSREENGGSGERLREQSTQQRWQTFFDSAKVRFCCQKCGHGWTSMKGRVVFWSIFNAFNGQGTLMFRLYGQKCQRCKSGHYENAMWYPEEVIKVLMNVYCHIGQFYYGHYQVYYTKSRRAGKPRTPHNSTLCQACHDGVCAERR